MNAINKILLLVFFFLALTNCSRTKNTTNNPLGTLYLGYDSIFYQPNKIFHVDIDTNLSYVDGFKCDSVIGIDYQGFDGDIFYYPINNNGQYLNTIIGIKKLTEKQVDLLNFIVGDSMTYKNSPMILCYEPRLGFIYFKDNKVIGQTQVCLGCSRLRSTTLTKDDYFGLSFNEESKQKLIKLRSSLGFKKE